MIALDSTDFGNFLTHPLVKPPILSKSDTLEFVREKITIDPTSGTVEFTTTATDDDLEKMRLYLIDLHRMQLRRKTPSRWIVKDIAGLYYSSMDIGLTKRVQGFAAAGRAVHRIAVGEPGT